MNYDVQVTPMQGGLDLVTPYLQVQPGRAIEALNYECLPRGGYRRIDGYVKFDGRSADAQAIPGAVGAVRGGFRLGTDTYAIVDLAGRGGLFKATAGGWVEQSLGSYVAFNTGTLDFNQGDAINGATSGATATVARRVLASGGFGTGDAVGLLVLTGITGTFSAGENLRVGATVHAKATAAQVAYTLPTGGRYETVIYNFFGVQFSRRIYGVSGVGPAFEYDGTTFVPIIQGPAGIYPKFIAAHSDHLMLGYDAGAVINSALGDPLDYTAANGAAEIDYGDNVTALKSLVGGALLVGCKQSTFILYGTDSSNWTKKKFTDHGIRSYTVGEIGGNVVVLDELGVQNLAATQAYGDFTSILVSFDVNPAIRSLLTSGITAASIISQAKDQYRLFFGPNGYEFTFNGAQLSGIMPIAYNDAVRCAWRGLDSNGIEVSFFGSDDGNVFQMDTSNFFDGDPIFYALRLPFVYEGNPTYRKRFRRIYIDATVTGEATEFNGSADYDNLQTDSRSTRFMEAMLSPSGGSSWNLGIWNNFNWSSQFYARTDVCLDGVGMNMSFLMAGTGEEDSTHTIYGVTIHSALRRMMR